MTAARRNTATAARPIGAQADSAPSGRMCWRMTAITRPVMTARNTRAVTYAVTDRQVAGSAAQVRDRRGARADHDQEPDAAGRLAGQCEPNAAQARTR